MIRRILVLSVVLLTSGCVASLSNRAPFRAMMGQELTLTEPAVIVMTEAWVGADIYWKAPSPRKTLMPAGFRLENYFDIVCTVPEGTPLRLRAVRRITTGIGQHVLAIGILNPGTDDEMEFIYNWGEPNHLSRAPWEPLPVREE